MQKRMQIEPIVHELIVAGGQETFDLVYSLMNRTNKQKKIGTIECQISESLGWWREECYF
jgi:hypothetical protein